MDMFTQIASLKAVIRKIAGSRHGDDLYQDVCVACLRLQTRREIDWSVPQTGLVIKIAKAQRVNAFRKERFSKVRKLTPAAADQIEDSRVISVPTLSGLEEKNELRLALRGLTPAHQMVLEWKYYFDEPDASVAARLRVSCAVIRQWRHRGLVQRKRRLNQV